jgi:preprotein translocase subunit SecD
MGRVRVLRTLAPLALVAGLLAACGGGSSSSPGGASSGDSTILGASPGFEVRTVYARYAPGVPFGPQLPKELVSELSAQKCPMQPRIVSTYLMECDSGKTVYLLNNPVFAGHAANATAKQIGHKNLWYVELGLDPSDAAKLDAMTKTMVGEQLAFSYGGSVLASVAIDSSFHAEHFALTGNYTKASATKLAHELLG